MTLKRNQILIIRGNMKKIKFSIIVPAYNTYYYIDKCLKSILKQNFKNLEIIVIDDGSTDNLKKKVKNLKKSYKNLIRFYRTKHRGVSNARNLGLKKSRGEYIVFVDSDDYLNYDIFNYINDFKENIDCFIIQFKTYDLTANRFINIDHDNILSVGNINKRKREDVLDEFYRTRTITPVWRFIVKSIIAKKIKFTKNIIFEDEEWSSKILIKAQSFHLIDKPCYVYAKRNNSITSTLNENAYISLMKICNNLLKIAEQQKDKYKSIFLMRKIYLISEFCYYKIRSISKPDKPL